MVDRRSLSLTSCLLLLPVAGAALAAEKELAGADTMLTFHKVHLTLENGESVRADVARIADGRVILYDHRALETDALIRPRVEEATRAVDMLEISQLEVRKSYVNTGAAIGVVGGITVLSLILIDLAADSHTADAQGIIAGVTVFGLAGAGIGALTGSMIPRWETVYDPAAGVALKRPPSYEPGVGYRLEEE